MPSGWDRVNNSRTPEERREAAAVAGRKSGETRRRNRTWRESVEMLMAGTLDEEHAAEIKRRYNLPEDVGTLTHQDQVIHAMSKKAEAGDKDAAQFLRDTAGQAPAQMVKLGNLDGPFESIDLGSLSDEDLRRLAEREKPSE